MKLAYSVQPEIAVFNDLSQLIISRKSVPVTLFLCGGSAIKIYQYFSDKFDAFLALAKTVSVTDFSYLTISLTDDRWFKDLNNENINSAVIKKTGLITKFEKYGASFIPMTNSIEIKDDVNNFNNIMIKHFNEDYKILIGGVGLDGHTCGIIPQNNEELFRSKYGLDQYCTDVIVDNIHPNRITLTPYSLIKMDDCLIYMSGDEKKNVLTNLLYESKAEWEMPSIVYQSNKNAKIYTDILL